MKSLKNHLEIIQRQLLVQAAWANVVVVEAAVSSFQFRRTVKTQAAESRFDMKTELKRFLANVAVCALLVTATATAKAQFGYKVTKGTEAGVVAVLVGVGAGAGIGIYFAFHHGHSLTGCTVSGSAGLQLQSDQQTYALIGDIAAIKAGDRVRLVGKKEKANGGSAQQFLVERVGKDYGACMVAPVTR
jgi:hypothetical protein